MSAVSHGSRRASGSHGAAAAILLLLVILFAPTAASIPATANPTQSDDILWLCHPDLPADPCRGDLTTTERTAGRPDSVVPTPEPRRHDVDCFYVYPTVSQEATRSASMAITEPVRAIARQQAQRFSGVCDVYAPVYRQRTLLALRTPSTPEQSRAAVELAYSDVVRAWERYLAQDNDGRGVVLIGHSQGTRLLRQLLRERIEPEEKADRRIVSAVLVGGNVVVPRGSDVGGDFRGIPLCRKRDQIHCVLAWSAFGRTPPADARYGIVPTTPEAEPAPYGPGYEIACVNPASPDRNAEVALHTLLRSDVRPGAVGLGELTPQLGPPPTAPTPWLRPAQRYRAQCTHTGDAHVLMVRPEPGAPALSPFPNPAWGLHVADMALPLGDIVDMVTVQIAAYQRHVNAHTSAGR